MRFLTNPLISRIRRNHGLEHATIHILSQRYPGTMLAGHSDTGGFWLFGTLETEKIQEAVEEALARMRSGEHGLAVHPNCGTNFVTAGVLAGLASGFAMFGARRWTDKLYRLPLAMTLATLALIFSRPLGHRIQELITTSGDPGDLEIVRVMPSRASGIFGRRIGQIDAHRVVTRG